MYGLTNLTASQINTIEKLAEYDVKVSKGDISKIGKSPTWLSIHTGLNKNNLIKDLPILKDLTLVEKEQFKTKTNQTWNYYALSELGEIIVTKELVKKTQDNLELKKILHELKDNLQYVTSFWDKLIDNFGSLPYWCLKQTILSFDFSLRLETHLHFLLVSAQITLPSKDGSGFNHLEKYHPLFIRNKKSTEKQFNLSNLGMVNPIPFKLDIDEINEKINANFNENLKTDIEDFLTYAFYCYLVQNIHAVKNGIETFAIKTKKIKPNKSKMFKATREKVKKMGNTFLTDFLNETSTYSDLNDIISQLDIYENKVNELLQNKALKNKLEIIQRSINKRNTKNLIS